MDNNENVRYIPENVINTQRIFRFFKVRNLIEGLIMAAIGIAIVAFIPFVDSVKLLFFLTVGGGLFLFGVNGIRNKSVSSFLFSIIRFRIVRTKYHKRSIDNVKKSATKNSNGENLTIAQAIFQNVKESRTESKTYGEKFKLKDFADIVKKVIIS